MLPPPHVPLRALQMVQPAVGQIRAQVSRRKLSGVVILVGMAETVTSSRKCVIQLVSPR